MRRGMTLVEILAVIVVIGLVLALLFPALRRMREHARAVECETRQIQVARGLMLLAEKNNAYPGWRQDVKAADGVDDPVGWAILAAPYLDAKSVADNWLREPDSSISRQDARIEILICPSDSSKMRESGPVLSYVINAGRPDSATDAPPDYRANGLAMDLTADAIKRGSKAVTPSYVRQADGLANTLLLTENLNATAWMAIDEWKTTVLWYHPPQPAHHVNSQDLTTHENQARPSSNHRGGVNAVMASGASRWIADDIDYAAFRSLMTPADAHAKP